MTSLDYGSQFVPINSSDYALGMRAVTSTNYDLETASSYVTSTTLFPSNASVGTSRSTSVNCDYTYVNGASMSNHEEREEEYKPTRECETDIIL